MTISITNRVLGLEKEYRMIDMSTFALFIFTSVAVILMPGPAMIGLTRGAKAGIAAAIGTTAGVSFHLLCAAFGLAVIMKTSVIVFSAVKYTGAAYLIYLALKTALSREEITSRFVDKENNCFMIFRQGVFINILNPKLSIFFLAFLPQFINSDLASSTSQTIILGVLFMAMTIVIFICYGVFASLLRKKVLASPMILKAMKWCFASVFMVLGLKLALSER